MGLAEKARSLFDQAAKLSPGNDMNLRAWAAFEAAQGNQQAARGLYQQALQSRPNDAVALQVHLL